MRYSHNPCYTWGGSFCLLVLILLTQTSTTFAQIDAPILIPTYHIGGETNTLFIDGNIAYVGSGVSLLTFDIFNPSDPVLLGQSVILNDVIEHIIVVNNLVFISISGRDGLVIIDVADPTTLSLPAYYEDIGYVSGVDVVGTTAYIANSTRGLTILDISDFLDVSNPYNITTLGSYDEGYIYDVAVIDGIGYVASSGDVIALDMTDPNNIVEIGRYDDLSGGALHLIPAESAYDDAIYVASGNVGLFVLEWITTAPVIITPTPTRTPITPTPEPTTETPTPTATSTFTPTPTPISSTSTPEPTTPCSTPESETQPCVPLAVDIKNMTSGQKWSAMMIMLIGVVGTMSVTCFRLTSVDTIQK